MLHFLSLRPAPSSGQIYAVHLTDLLLIEKGFALLCTVNSSNHNGHSLLYWASSKRLGVFCKCTVAITIETCST